MCKQHTTPISGTVYEALNSKHNSGVGGGGGGGEKGGVGGRGWGGGGGWNW